MNCRSELVLLPFVQLSKSSSKLRVREAGSHGGTLQLYSVSPTRLLLPQVPVINDVASPALVLCREPLLFRALQKEPPGRSDPLPLGAEVWSRWVTKPVFSPALPGEGAVEQGLGLCEPSWGWKPLRCHFSLSLLYTEGLLDLSKGQLSSPRREQPWSPWEQSGGNSLYSVDPRTLTLSHCHLLYPAVNSD